MSALNPKKVGITLGCMIGLMHLGWSVVVALGLAQPLIDWILKIHMIEMPHTVLPFSFLSAVTLVVIMSLIGFIVGYIFATIWNHIQK